MRSVASPSRSEIVASSDAPDVVERQYGDGRRGRRRGPGPDHAGAALQRVELGAQRRRRLVAVVGVLGEQRVDDPFELNRMVRRELADGHVRLRADGRGQRRLGWRSNGQAPVAIW